MTNYIITSEKPLSEPAVNAPAARVLRSMVRGYQQLFAGHLSPCRFYPSCSNYALEALEVHGAVRGSWLTFRRLARCRPFGPHGVDLVPESHTTRSPRSCTP
jgi:uncharacterized protein